MKRTIGTIAVLSVAAAGLVACSSDSDPQEPQVEEAGSLRVLTMWQPNTSEGAAQKQALARFTEQTGIEIELSEAGQEAGDVYETEYTAGDPPDVVFVNLYDKTLGWTEAGVTVDVGGYLEEWELSDSVEPAALDSWTTQDGKLRAFPFQGFNWPVLWNTGLLDEAGVSEVPATTDDLLDLAAATEDVPFAAGGADWSGEKLFSQIVQDRIEADEAVSLFSAGGWKDSAAARSGVELFVELRDAGVFGPNAQGYSADMMYAEYNEGGAIGMSAGSWVYAATPEDLWEPTYLSGFPISAESVHDRPTAYRGFTSVGFWISPAGAEKIDAVRQLIEFMYSEETVAEFVSLANIVPAVKIADSGSLVKNPLMASSLNDLPDRVSFIVLQDTYVPASVAADYTAAASLAWGDASVDEILAALDQAYGK